MDITNVFKPKSRREVLMIEIIQADPTLHTIWKKQAENDYQFRIKVSNWATIFYKLRKRVARDWYVEPTFEEHFHNFHQKSITINP